MMPMMMKPGFFNGTSSEDSKSRFLEIFPLEVHCRCGDVSRPLMAIPTRPMEDAMEVFRKELTPSQLKLVVM